MGLQHEDFMRLFDSWAPTYDQTVADPRSEGFENYGLVLNQAVAATAAAPGDLVVDVGAGTGNLSAALLTAGCRPVAVEPSPGMRAVARLKLPGAQVLDGHFLAVPLPDGAAAAAVSTYAFHHLDDVTKPRGARELLRVVRPGGRVVIGDVAFRDQAHRTAFRRALLAQGKADLVRELDEEYYTTVAILEQPFREAGCQVSSTQLDPWVWLTVAVKAK